MSVPVPRFPDVKNESCDQSDHDKHPVLAFEAQNREMIDEKLHRVRPAFVQRKRFRDKNILFLYYFGWIAGPLGRHFLPSFGCARMLHIKVAG